MELSNRSKVSEKPARSNTSSVAWVLMAYLMSIEQKLCEMKITAQLGAKRNFEVWTYDSDLASFYNDIAATG